MKRLPLLIGTAVLVLSAGCAGESGEQDGGIKGPKVVITASDPSSGTRAALDDDGMTVSWTDEDAIGVFMKCPQDTYSRDSYTIVPGSYGDDDPNADFEGSLHWGDEPGYYTFYGYNPLRGELQSDPRNILVTLPPFRSKAGGSTLHYSNGYFVVAEPRMVSSQGARSEPQPVPLKFYHLFPLVELRFAALNCEDMVIESVMLRSGSDLSVVDACLDVTKMADELGFAMLRGGGRHKMIQLSITNAPEVPATDDPELNTSSQKATPGNVFATRMNILPGVHGLTIVVSTNKGVFKFSKSEKELKRGKRYVSTLVLDPESSNVSQSDGTSTRPEIDDVNKKIEINNAGEFLWFCRRTLGIIHEPPWNFVGYEIKLNTDIDLGGEPWTDQAILRGCCMDGQGHTVYNVNITSGGSNIGFISQIGTDGELKNLHVEGVVSVDAGKTASNIGGLCGFVNSGGKISGCSFTGRVEVTGQCAYVGGLVGYITSDKASITASANYADIENRATGKDKKKIDIAAGGVAGRMSGALVTACYNMGSVDGVQNVGGLVGRGSKSCEASYNAGTVSRVVNSGQIYGTPDGAPSLTSCYGAPDSDGVQAPALSDGNWPANSGNWGVGDGSGTGLYWKSLGGWNGGYASFPKLWWE